MDAAQSRKAPRRAARALWIATALLLLPALGGRDLWAPDEPRVALVAEELRAAAQAPGARARDWLLLRLHGEIYTQKPPLYYAVAAAIGAASGRVDEWSARLPSALAGVACVFMTFALARRLFGMHAALWAGTLLLLSHRFIHLARRAQLDVVLTAFELGALLLWVRIERGELLRGRGTLALHALLGAAALTKGPVGWLPLAVFAVLLAWERRGGELRTLLRPAALALSIGPLAAWGAFAIATAPEGFFQVAVIDNLWGRFFAGTSHARPITYYALQLPLDFAPASLLLPFAALAAVRGLRSRGHDAHARRTRADWRLLVAWSAGFLLFFSLSAGKRGLYLLPAFPVLATMCAAPLADALRDRSSLPGRTGLGLAVVALAAAALAALGLSHTTGEVFAMTGMAGLAPEALERLGIDAAARPAAVFCAGLLALACASLTAGGVLARRRASASARAALVAASVAGLHALGFFALYPALDAERSPRPIAGAAAAAAAPGSPIGVFQHPSMAPGIAYYAHRPVALLADRAAFEGFLASGGRAVVVDAYKIARLEPIAPLVRRASLRHGRREVLVLGPPSGLEAVRTHEQGGP